MPKPPSWFKRALACYDSNLRIRWSFEKRKWAIEARAKGKDGLVPPVKYVPRPDGEYDEILLTELSDKRIGWKDGYYAILYCKYPSNVVLKIIRESDWAKFKSAKETEKKIEEDERMAEMADKKSLKNESDAAAGEMYDYIKTKIGERTFMGSSSPISDSSWY